MAFAIASYLARRGLRKNSLNGINRSEDDIISSKFCIAFNS
jgi:hypothetical protein